MNLRDILKNKINLYDIRCICQMYDSTNGVTMKDELYALIFDCDDRVGYNALWIFCHLPHKDRIRLSDRRNELTDYLLTTEHTGKRRLILSLFENMPTPDMEIRCDYLDFCLSKINSTEPYAIRALCLKQAFAQCRNYPELMDEFIAEVELMETGELSPGLSAARRNVMKHFQTRVQPCEKL